MDEGECHHGSPAEDDNIREEGTNSCKSTDMIYINITHVARDRYRDRDRWRDTGVKCYVGTLVTILVCTSIKRSYSQKVRQRRVTLWKLGGKIPCGASD